MQSITQEMVDQANAEEEALMSSSPAILQAQNRYLQERIVLLRASANQLQAELDELRGGDTAVGENVSATS